MFKTRIFGEMFSLVSLTVFLNYIANYFHLYWSVYWFDKLLHFLGGAGAAGFFIWLYFFSNFFGPRKRNLKDFFIISVLGGLMVSFVWEVYEIYFGKVFIKNSGYIYDTTIDVLMGFLGSIAFCFYGYFYELKKEEKNLNDIKNIN